MTKTRKFTIECEIPERWVNDFCSFIKYLEFCGNIGHSASVSFYADGDGDFRPQFDINTQFDIKMGKSHSSYKLPPEVIFDAD